MPDDLLVCRTCGVSKPLPEMKRKGDGHESLCKVCDVARARQYHQAHREERLAFNQAYRRRPDAVAREQERLRRRQADPAHRASERERHRRDRTREATKQRTRDYLKGYYAKRKDIEHAHTAVKYALKTGRLSKPTACSDCGAVVALHAHHDDYTQPLMVRWLCPLCHKATHKEQRCA